MRRTDLVTCVGVLVAIGAGLVSGCAVRRTPSEEAVLFYVRAAQVDGKVRRTWPAGQEYVDSILEIDAQLEDEIAELEHFCIPEELWLREDPQWRDEKAVTERIEELREILEGHRPARETMLRELDDAIRKIPMPLAETVGAERFVQQVWDALSPWGSSFGKPVRTTLGELEECLALHLELCRTVQECAEFLDPHGRGLAMAGEGCREKIVPQHDKLTYELESRRESITNRSEEELLKIRRKLESGAASMSKHERQYLMDLRKHLRDGLEALPKDLYEATRQAQRELADVQEDLAKAEAADERTELAQKAALLELAIERLEASRARYKPRVEEVLAADDS